ncbi:Uncharacterised protein [Mycobacteroides abscessus subsp. abscessus]|nr:Uncharacterised protein [Mycobacteroides abscessus subsp. abscessus]
MSGIGNLDQITRTTVPMFGACHQTHRTLDDVDGGLARALVLTQFGAFTQGNHRLAQYPFMPADNRVRGVMAVVGTLEQLTYHRVDRAFLHHSISCPGGRPVNPPEQRSPGCPIGTLPRTAIPWHRMAMWPTAM